MDDQYKLWNKFLSVWSRDRLSKMKLDEYTQAGSQDCFTYWIESRLDKMGSIWGGSSFKFGVYSRRAADVQQNDNTRSYSADYGWYTSLGATAEEAFEKIHGYILQVVDWASKGKIDEIESFEYLGEAFKWKIAFHYQDQSEPIIAPVFKRVMLAAFVGKTVSESMASLQKLTLEKKSENLGILEFGKKIWEEWGKKNLAIWKLSHGNPPSFTDDERKKYLAQKLAIVHGSTGHGQGKKFKEAPVGALFFLCHGNSTQIIGQFTSEVSKFGDKDGDGWLQRSYRILKWAKRTDRYTANSRRWSPQGNSTFWQVPADHLPEFESTLLKPFFEIDLAELSGLSGESVDATNFEGNDGSSPEILQMKGGKINNACFNRIYYGPPGTGKTYALMQLLKRDYEINDSFAEQRYSFVTFHQSYGYEEFVEGLRPVLQDKSDTGMIEYEIRPGVFKDLCYKARQKPEQRFAMVIDEINRGNISKIFGELITLIESDKRDPMNGSKPPLELKLAYSGEKFSVPANVDIIGTMNTADRSLALLDTAIRRRFDFIPLFPDTRDKKEIDDPKSAPLADKVVTTVNGMIDLRLMLLCMNQRIEVLYDRDHCIGHAIFTPLADIDDDEIRFDKLVDIFRNRIVPLLEEYFFEDWSKIRLVLGDNQKQIADQFIKEIDSDEQNLIALFGANHGLDSYISKRRYQLQPDAFNNPASYIGIYQNLS